MAGRNPRPSRPRAPAWLCWIGVLLAVRGALVLAVADVSFWGEELARGTAAKALIDGVDIPLHQLFYNEFEGGSLLSELLLVPAFLLVGQNLLAHKLVALAWLLASFAVGLKLCERFLGVRAMHAFGLLFVLAPGSFQKLSLINLGSHFGSLLFLLSGMYFLLALVCSERVRARDAAGLGLSASLGSTYSFQVAVFAAFAFAVLLSVRREALRGRAGRIGWGALALGLVPLGWMLVKIGPRIFDVHGSRADVASELSALERLSAFLHSIFDARGALDIAAILAVVALVAWAAWAVRSAAEQDSSRKATRILLAFFLLFTAIYLFSSYAQGAIGHWFQFNRLSPLWLVATLLAAAACERAWSQRTARFWAAGLVLLAALGGLRDFQRGLEGGLARSVSDGLQRLSHFNGVTYFGFFTHLREKRRLEFAEEARLWFSFDEPARAWLEASATAALFHDPQTGFAEGTQFVATLAPEGWRGLGIAFGRSQPGGLKAAVFSALDAPLERRPALLEAIGRATPNPMALARELRQLRTQSSARPEQEICLDALAFGLGNKLFEYPGEVDARYFERSETAWCLNAEAFERWCAQLDATDRDREQLRAGYKRAFDERTNPRYAR